MSMQTLSANHYFVAFLLISFYTINVIMIIIIIYNGDLEKSVKC